MEILLPIFLLSGQFKSYLNFFGFELPLDITLVSGFLVVVMVVINFYKHQHLATRAISYYGIGILLVFYGWLIFTLFYTSSEEYSITKTVYFALNIIAFATPLVYTGFRIARFIRFFAILSIGLSVLLLPFQYFDFTAVVATGEGVEDSFDAIGGLYLTLSNYLGLLIVLCLTSKVPVLKNRRRDVLLVLFALFLLTLLGARGPILFAVVACILYYLYNLKVLQLAIGVRTVKILVFSGVALMILLVLMVQFDITRSLLARSFGRFYSLIAGIFSPESQDLSSLVRIKLYQEAIEGIFAGLRENVIGYGIGSFGIETIREDIRLYPHNIILEIWFELGLIGLLIFVAWVVYLLTQTIRLPYRQISYWLLLYFLLNLMKSSSLVDIRTEFTFLALYITQFIQQNKSQPHLNPRSSLGQAP